MKNSKRTDILLGRQLILDIQPKDVKVVEDNDLLLKYFELALEKCHVTIEETSEKYFEPHGYTLLFLLSESHFALHTWPEYNMLCIDLFACGDIDFDAFINVVNNLIPNQIVQHKRLERSFPTSHKG